MELPTLKSERLYQKISNLLIERIRSGQFVPGQALPSERDLSKQMGVSRSSVREALIVLEISGWVEIRTGNGVFVKEALPSDTPSVGDEAGVVELLKAREVIEGEIACLAALNASDDQREELAGIMEDMQHETADNIEFHDLDKRFHMLLGDMTGNPVLRELTEYLWNKRYSPIFMHFETYYAGRDISEDMARDHIKIVEAIQARDGKDAKKAMQAHLRHVYQSLFKAAG
ncbi:MAG: FadR family transcriptional regulator [Paludibacterium sp.]|uniref:FadR/GntR family transcriptional regulator n=1 Tax=Paludibacterium sp. TaxID=1917523 RepID=UPI0025F64C79|nr:FadR/GntR family transcriptional regulator [Paludibacterium sp.]MBV8048370.1 FadR family transcriptional regulator [Paludibacterium sp.]